MMSGYIINYTHRQWIINIEIQLNIALSIKINQEYMYQIGKIKKTSSIILDEDGNHHNAGEKQLRPAIDNLHPHAAREQLSISANSRLTIPSSIIESIRHTGSKRSSKSNMKASKNIVEKYKQMRGLKFQCDICQQQYDEKDKARIADCSHYYCQSCLQHHAIYQVGKFLQITCPDAECRKVINFKGKIYESLPAQIRKKYVKIHNFHLTVNDPNLRLCPNGQCEQGILKLEQGSDPTCSICNKTFCRLCFFPVHEGKCEKNQLQFFENNLKYRQCKKCKNVVERSEGCNHMTCLCGYQFCYICGKRWKNYAHQCPIQANIGAVNARHRNGNEQTNICVLAIKFIAVGIFCLPIWMLVTALLMLKLICISFFLLVGSIAYGLCGASISLIDEAESTLLKSLMIVFLPLTLLAGIFIGISEVFIQAFCEEITEACYEVEDLTECLLCWPLDG